jgi:hypothetical protein
VDVATTLRERGGETEILDGPCAVTEEYLAGFYVLECADLDEASPHARRIPVRRYDAVEVRPIMDGRWRSRTHVPVAANRARLFAAAAGVGTSFCFPTVANAIMSSIPIHEAGVASETNSAIRELGVLDVRRACLGRRCGLADS